MIIPVRCFSCGKPVGKDWDEYVERSGKGEDPKEVLDALGYTRYCCRRMFITHSEIIDDVMHHKRF
ncbi:MAG: DNA-directed RNA polymerase subunit N [Candidatus Altiarchaeales archaeon]|nr:DNA-directed RNA polymerase subunit N [Candidatus Altiarchaeales archaeon]MBD3415689.1 DNA-directed RNA polymerase subunit N [Candidatus Altiarchaeales archaeon]